MLSLAHLYLGSFSHSSLQILSSSVKLDGSVTAQIFSDLFRFVRVQARALVRPLKDIQRDLYQSYSRVALAVCLGSLSCWKLKLHPSLRCWAPWSRFASRISLYFESFIFPSILTSLPVPAAEKHPHSMILSPAWIHHRDCARFPPDVTLGIQAKEFNLGFIRPENLVSQGLRVL